MEKRGLSPVIAVVLVILLTVTAIMIIAGFIIPFVRDNLSESTKCLDYREYFSFEEVFESDGEDLRYNCFDENNLHGAAVRAGNVPEEKNKVIGLDLLFVREGVSEKISVRSGESTSEDGGNVRMLSKKVTELEVPRPGGIRTYVFNGGVGAEAFEKVEVYPVLDSDGSEKVCEMSDSIKLRACNPANVLEVD